MRLTADLRYPADPAAVFAMLVDKAFQEVKLGSASSSAQISVELRGPDGADGAVITSVFQLPTGDMPGAVRNIVGDTLQVERTEDWGPPAPDGSRTGTLTLRTPQGPVRMTGELRLRPDGDGSVQTVDADLTAKVPLIGGRIEKAAHPALLAAIKAEGRAGAAWLAERG